MSKFLSYLAILFLAFSMSIDASLLLRDNLSRAQQGDFIVIAQGKNYNLLHIYAKSSNELTIEEISIPSSKIPKKDFSWKMWVQNGAMGCSSRVVYTLDSKTGQIRNFYALKQGRWYEMSPQSNFLPTLLNLQFNYIPPSQRRRIGINFTGEGGRALWQPKMVVDGSSIEGVQFNAWKATWPKDGSDLSGKTIEVYLPEENTSYPAYFPYWLQISGLVGNAKIRIVDSGTQLTSSLPNLPRDL